MHELILPPSLPPNYLLFLINSIYVQATYESPYYYLSIYSPAMLISGSGSGTSRPGPWILPSFLRIIDFRG